MLIIVRVFPGIIVQPLLTSMIHLVCPRTSQVEARKYRTSQIATSTKVRLHKKCVYDRSLSTWVLVNSPPPSVAGEQIDILFPNPEISV